MHEVAYIDAGMPHRRFSLRHVPVLLAALVLALIPARRAHGQQSAAVLPPAGTTVHRDIQYVSNGHERQRLDLYVPADRAAPVPIIVWIHGGGWTSRSKYDAETHPFRNPLLENGFAVASINYRLSQHAAFPAQIQDAKAAVRWLRANAARYGLDPARISAVGWSAGGHLGALLGSSGGIREFEVGDNLEKASAVRAVIAFYPAVDFLQMDQHRLPGGRVHDDSTSEESRLIGGPIQERRELVKSANPVTYVTADDPPFFIIHGTRDLTVPYHQSQILTEALQTKGVPVTLRTIDGGGHGGPEFRTHALLREIIAFLSAQRVPSRQ
jgi:acetyl esterase/lipase